MNTDTLQPTPHRPLKTNVLRIRQIPNAEMDWIFHGVYGLVESFRELMNANADALTFYGIVDDKTIYPELNIGAVWDKTDDPKEFAKLIKNTVKQTRVMDATKSSFAGAIQKLGIAANILKDANDSFSEILADVMGKRYDIVGPATKKNYGKPRMGNIGFDCVYDLRAGQMKFAANMIRTILDIVHPRSTPASTNDVDITLLQKASKKTVDWFKNIFGMHLTYNPFPVEVTLGQHFYMAPAIVQDVIINSSSDYFDYVPYENAPPEDCLKLPAFIRVSIKLAPYMLPDPGKSWLVYSGYNMMGPYAGQLYEAGSDAI
jgi:hypothetical protein